MSDPTVVHKSDKSYPEKRNSSLIIALGIAFALPLLIWYTLYRFAGYSPRTLLIGQLAIFLAGPALVQGLRLSWADLGLGLRKLAYAALALVCAYGLIFLASWVLRQIGALNLPLLQKSYTAHHFIDNWVLTGLGEEFLFAGVLFSLVRTRLNPQAARTGSHRGSRQAWLAVLIVAVLFALWHLPGHIAMGRSFGSILGRLVLHCSSWLFFGTIYTLSGNLWLTALAHGSTDFPLTPLIQGQPTIGLIFMGLLVAAAHIAGRREKTLTASIRTSPSNPLNHGSI